MNRSRGAAWLALALGLAAAGGTAHAAIVQITLNQTYNFNSSPGFIDITKDGNVDHVELRSSSFSGESYIAFANYYNPELPYYSESAYSSARQVYDFSTDAHITSYTGSSGVDTVYFTDDLINGGEQTFGRLETSWAPGTLTAVRLVFDNESTTAPTGPLAASYSEFGTSAVPEASTSLGLLALGAAGLLTRRRKSRKA